MAAFALLMAALFYLSNYYQQRSMDMLEWENRLLQHKSGEETCRSSSGCIRWASIGTTTASSCHRIALSHLAFRWSARVESHQRHERLGQYHWQSASRSAKRRGLANQRRWAAWPCEIHYGSARRRAFQNPNFGHVLGSTDDVSDHCWHVRPRYAVAYPRSPFWRRRQLPAELWQCKHHGQTA